MIYKLVTIAVCCLIVLGVIGYLFVGFMACSMSDAPVHSLARCILSPGPN